MKVVIDPLDSKSIDRAINFVKNYGEWLNKKIRELQIAIGENAKATLESNYQGARYDGDNDVTVTYNATDNSVTIIASGKALMFIEFGTGLEGNGHPDADKFGFGAGTWSTNEALGGKGHWNNPKGWYYGHGKKSFGNPPAMVMYNYYMNVDETIVNIAREVFAND